MENNEIKYVLPVSQYDTSSTLNPVTNVDLSGINTYPSGLAHFAQSESFGTSPTLPKSDDDKIKKIAIYSVSGIALIVAIILLIKALRK